MSRSHQELREQQMRRGLLFGLKDVSDALIDRGLLEHCLTADRAELDRIAARERLERRAVLSVVYWATIRRARGLPDRWGG